MSIGDGRTPNILTPDQRLRVFVSSTMKELAAERHAASKAIRDMRMIPVTVASVVEQARADA